MVQMAGAESLRLRPLKIFCTLARQVKYLWSRSDLEREGLTPSHRGTVTLYPGPHSPEVALRSKLEPRRYGPASRRVAFSTMH